MLTGKAAREDLCAIVAIAIGPSPSSNKCVFLPAQPPSRQTALHCAENARNQYQIETNRRLISIMTTDLWRPLFEGNGTRRRADCLTAW
jgi:hypothetical protein